MVVGKVREQLVDPRFTKMRDRPRCNTDNRIVSKPLNRISNVAALSKEIAENRECLEHRQCFDRTASNLEESRRFALCQNLRQRGNSIDSKLQYLSHTTVTITE
jgi:hypothetical protein